MKQTTKLQVLDPRAELRPAAHSVAPRLPSLKGKSVALLDNIKPNANVILGRVGEILVAQYGAAKVDLIAKRGPATPAEGPILDQIATTYDAVVTGLGD